MNEVKMEKWESKPGSPEKQKDISSNISEFIVNKNHMWLGLGSYYVAWFQIVRSTYESFVACAKRSFGYISNQVWHTGSFSAYSKKGIHMLSYVVGMDYFV